MSNSKYCRNPVDQLFADMFRGLAPVTFPANSALVDRKTTPPVNIVQTTENTHKLEVSVPGFDENEVSVSLHEGYLIVEAKHEDTTAKADEEVKVQQFVKSSFRREFKVSDQTEVHEAVIKNGILTVILEHVVPEEEQPKKINVKAA